MTSDCGSLKGSSTLPFRPRLAKPGRTIKEEKMKIKKILFVCKHNVFRSRVAEEYMKQKSNYDISSAGIIMGDSLPKTQKDAALRFGFDISFNSKTLSIDLLREQDLVVVVANDIPKKLFDSPLYNLKGKLIFWKIKDVQNLFNPSEKNSIIIIEAIIKKVNKLNERLEMKR